MLEPEYSATSTSARCGRRARSLGYDSNGDMVRTDIWIDRRGTTTYYYDYDLEDRLVRVRTSSTEITSYAYFSDGSRTRRTASGAATYFLHDFSSLNGILAEYDSGGAMVARYIHGPGIDEPLAVSRGGSWYYYHVDGLGSVTMLTRADKTVANRYVYDDFGGFRSRTEAVTNSYAFTGREYDAAVDLIFYRARYYDPLIGRFLTRDPAGMGNAANLYAYVGNNPVNHVDPSGLGGFYHDGGGSDSYRSGGVGFSPIWYQPGPPSLTLPNIDWGCILTRMGQECACLVGLILIARNPALAAVIVTTCQELYLGEPSFCDLCAIPCLGLTIPRNPYTVYIAGACGICLLAELALKAYDCSR